MPISQTEAQQHVQRGFNGNLRSLAQAIRGLVNGDFLAALISATTGWRDTRTTPIFNQGAAGTLNATGTLTAALMMGGLVTSTTAAAVTATLDTGANLEAALLAAYPGLAVSDYFEFSIINTGAANTITVATAAGWTDGGEAFTAVAAHTAARFGVRRTAANTYTIFKIA